MMSLRQTVEEQVHAIQVFWQGPKPQVFGQNTPAAAAHLQDGKARQAFQAILSKGTQNSALATLDNKQIGGIKPGIQVPACKTKFAVRIFPPQAGNVTQQALLAIQEPCPWYRPSGSRI